MRQRVGMGVIALITWGAALAGLLTLPAAAAPVMVRSGEHDGFTRLVLDLPAPAQWRLSKTADGAQIALQGLRAEFDLRNAFRKITAKRVAGLTPVAAQNALAIKLNCVCAANAFLIPPRMLVIDIRDQPETAETPPAAPPARQARPRPTYRFPFDHHPGASELEARPDAPSDAAPPKPVQTETVPPPAQTHDRSADISTAERRLAEQLSRAVAQGLVAPKQAPLPRPAPARAVPEEHQAAPEQAQPTQPPSKPAPRPGVNLRAETSVDRDFTEVENVAPQTHTGATCVPEKRLDITDWAAETPFAEQVGALRAQLVGEFDRPDPVASKALAKLYISFGFGAEALNVLTAAKLDSDAATLLTALGEITEYGHARRPAQFAGQYDCDTPAAFWAILADERIPSSATLNDAAILRAINGLPGPLRELLGPIASARLLAVGEADLAAKILRPVVRVANAPNSRLDMAEAELQLATGDPQEASNRFTKVIEANTDLSPEAVIGLIDSRLESGQTIDIGLADLAGAYAHEYRESPRWDGLKRAQILALASAGAFEKAFHELASFSAKVSPDTARTARSRTMGALARGAGDVSFLKYALDRGAAEIDPAAGTEVARRLVDLGFPAAARSYLGAPASGAVAQQQRSLLARAALALGKPRQAEADLLGLSGPDAARWRARAHAQAGDHATARRLYAALGETEDATREAWLARDWQALGTSKDSVLKDTVDLLTRPAADPPADSGVLAQDHALLEESRAARDTLAQLLSHFANLPAESGENR